MVEGWDGAAGVTWIGWRRVVPCEVYSRVVGFFRPVQNWNLGKRAEFRDRVPYRIDAHLREQENHPAQ